MDAVYQRLAHPTPAGLAQIRHIYEANFPPVERKPFETLHPLIAAGPYICMVARARGEAIIAFALVLSLPGQAAFLEYFAVSQSAQGQGIGSSLLKQTANYLVQEDIAASLVWEVEPPLPHNADAPQNRRIRFYQKLGAMLIAGSTTYRMPDYANGSAAGIPLRLMQLPASPQPSLAQVRQTVAAIYGIAYPDHVSLLNAIQGEPPTDSSH